MSPLLVKYLKAPLLCFDVLESTNNYAMQLIDTDKCSIGTTIVAGSQTAGKGQRGNTWKDKGRDALLMSVSMSPNWALHQQFLFLAQLAVAVAGVVQRAVPLQSIYIKWPNDIIINDRKAGGILIENIIRGSDWSWAVVGIGINVNQPEFEGLPFATSILKEKGNTSDIASLQRQMREAVLETICVDETEESVLAEYNALLYKAGKMQAFRKNGKEVFCKVNKACAGGELLVESINQEIRKIVHGELEWVIG